MNEFDALGMYAAMEAQRAERGLSWRQVATEIWEQSIVLNARRQDHPIIASTLTGIASRGDCTCQHALFMLRWLGRTPESFLAAPPTAQDALTLPPVGRDERLRWNFAALGCTEHQVTGIRTARFAIGMKLAMRIAVVGATGGGVHLRRKVVKVEAPHSFCLKIAVPRLDRVALPEAVE